MAKQRKLWAHLEHETLNVRDIYTPRYRVECRCGWIGPWSVRLDLTKKCPNSEKRPAN